MSNPIAIQTFSDTSTYNVTLDASTTYAIVVYTGFGGEAIIPTGATLNGSLGANIIGTTFTGGDEANISVFEIKDPTISGVLSFIGTTQTFNTVMIYEFAVYQTISNTQTQSFGNQSAPYTSVFNFTGGVGKSALALFTCADSIVSTVVPTASANLVSNYNIDSKVQLIGGYDTDVASDPEAYSVIFDHQGAGGGFIGNLIGATLSFEDAPLFRYTSTPTTLSRGSTGSIVVSGGAVAPTTSNTTLKLNGTSGELLTVDTITGTEPYTINFTVPSAIALRHDLVGYTLHVDVSGESAESDVVPLLAQDGWNYFDVDHTVADVTTDASVFYNDTASTMENTQYVFETTTTGGLTVSVMPEGYVNLSATPDGVQSFNGYVIEAGGTLRSLRSFELQSNVNAPPIVNTGVDQINVVAGSTVTFNGSSSDTDGSIASILWTQTSGDIVTLSSTITENPSFSAPITANDQVLVFRKTVTDNEGLTAFGDISISVLAEVVTSTINITLSGIQDGAAKTVLVDVTDIDNPVLLSTQSLTYSSGVATAILPIAAGQKVVSIELGNNPKVTGGADYGVTG